MSVKKEQADQETPTVVAVPKVTSKASLAKRLTNKKIKINTHIKFDEDGDQVELTNDQEEEISDTDTPLTESIAPIPIVVFEQSNETSVGGIDVDNAQELIRSRDKSDRKRERERIKAAHRERRLKRNRQTYAESEKGSQGVMLASPVENKDQTMEPDEQKERPSQDSSDSKYDTPPRAKRKKVAKHMKKKHEQLGTESAPPDLNEDEELVLHLLAS